MFLFATVFVYTSTDPNQEGREKNTYHVQAL